MLRHGERGQAVFETALFMPLILLGLFGVFLAASQGAMSERVQLAVRYGGIISGAANPYVETSLYAMYATLDGLDPDPNTCVATSADTALLSANRTTFWQPVAGSTTSSCWQNREIMFAGSYNPSYFNGYNFWFHDNFIRVSTQTPINIFLTNGALHGQSAVAAFAAEDFTSAGTLGDMLECTYVGATAKASLESNTYQPPLDYLSINGNTGPPGNPPGNGGGGWLSSNTLPLPTTLPLLINIPYPLTCNGIPETTAPGPTPSPQFGPQTIHTPPAT